MEKTNKKVRVSALLTAVVACAALALCLAACGGSGSSSSSSSSAASSSSSAASSSSSAASSSSSATGAAAADASFTETPITNTKGEYFEDVPMGVDEKNPLFLVSGVYFQPVPMDPDYKDITGYDIHLEADVSASKNNAGYPEGSWIPYMTVNYKITDTSGAEVATGAFMEMNADDGPHYGANVKLPNAGTYNLELTFKSPADNEYQIHSDSETGPGGVLSDYFGESGVLTTTFEDWAYAGSMADQAK